VEIRDDAGDSLASGFVDANSSKGRRMTHRLNMAKYDPIRHDASVAGIEQPSLRARSAKRLMGPIAVLIVAWVASFAMPAPAAPLQKPEEIRRSCGSDDTYCPPDDKGVYACLRKDSSGIVCGGQSEDNRKTCETWSANGSLPSRASDALRAVWRRQTEKAAADKAKAAKAASENKPAAGSSGSGSSTTSTSTAVHDCSGTKRNCGAWGPKDKNTCRTCQQAQCKTENGKDVLAGNKTQTECYEGHGPPP
jgi:hypothetical protein